MSVFLLALCALTAPSSIGALHLRAHDTNDGSGSDAASQAKTFEEMSEHIMRADSFLQSVGGGMDPSASCTGTSTSGAVCDLDAATDYTADCVPGCTFDPNPPTPAPEKCVATEQAKWNTSYCNAWMCTDCCQKFCKNKCSGYATTMAAEGCACATKNQVHLGASGTIENHCATKAAALKTAQNDQTWETQMGLACAKGCKQCCATQAAAPSFLQGVDVKKELEDAERMQQCSMCMLEEGYDPTEDAREHYNEMLESKVKPWQRID